MAREADTVEAQRRLPVGAEPQPQGGVHFRVWAPRRNRVEVLMDGTGVGYLLKRDEHGYFSGLVREAAVGLRYRYRLDNDPTPYPDPASRFQPDGPHGASQVVDPGVFRWTDQSWRGPDLGHQVFYELHVGTYTSPGTWTAAAAELPELSRVGVTTVELLPVAEFAGRFGWGYDGVDLYAPTRLYGTPDDFRHFVDQAHAAGLAVILDVVYNHIGPDGNFLRLFADEYFSPGRMTEWGEAINFGGDGAAPVREFFVANAGYWVDEYHLDGLRLDATQTIYDPSIEHVLAVIARRVRAAAGDRRTLLVAENETQDTRLLRRPEEGGYGLDAVWNDDFHHAAIVALTGRNEAYFSDYRGSPQEFVSLAKRGYLFQGQRYQWQHKRRGTPTYGLSPERFISYIQNHDQIANSGRGFRGHMVTSPGRYKAMTALLLLGPGMPLLFQGQEFAASSPFFYFADHREDLAKRVHEGRARFLAQFRSLSRPEMQAYLPDPADPQTFVRSKLNLTERQTHAEIYHLHLDLIRLRREQPAFHVQRAEDVDGAVLGPESFALRFFHGGVGDRLLVVNFGLDLHLDPAPEPLLAPPPACGWDILWSSEDPRYGGRGTAPLDTVQNWLIPGHAAVVLTPKNCGDRYCD